MGNSRLIKSIYFQQRMNGKAERGPSVHTADYDAALERREALTLATTWRDPGDTGQ